jgi:hypothetical protein
LKTIEIELTKGYKALIDEDDYERVSQFKWRATVRNTVVYAGRGWREDGRQRHEYLHRFIVVAKPGDEVDHRDGNGLNCTKLNLRSVTHAQNAMNRGRFSKGISFHKRMKKWQAYITLDGRHVHLGVFETEDEAKAVREAAVERHFGDMDSRKAERISA